MLLRGDERVRILAVEVMQLGSAGALLVDPKFADSLQCVDASLNERPAGKRQLLVALAKRLREADRPRGRPSALRGAPPPRAARASAPSMDHEGRARASRNASRSPTASSRRRAAARAARRRRCRRRRRRRRRRSAPRRCVTTRSSCVVGRAAARGEGGRRRRAAHAVGLARVPRDARAIGAGDTRTLEALGRLDFLPTRRRSRSARRLPRLGVPVFALPRGPVLEEAMRVLHAHYGALKAAADWPRLPARERAEALMGFAGASSALGMHYGSTATRTGRWCRCSPTWREGEKKEGRGRGN